MKIKMFRRKVHRLNKSRVPCVVIFSFLLIALFVFPAPPGHCAAKDWPTKTITLIILWPAGGGTDVAGRILAPKLSKTLGVPIQVVNKPGGSGIIGTLEAVKAPPRWVHPLYRLRRHQFDPVCLVRKPALQGGGEGLHRPGDLLAQVSDRPRELPLENRG